MCALCAIWHLQACLSAFDAYSMSAHVYTRLKHILPIAASCAIPDSCGANVRYENHSDKLLRENFTMKRIFRLKAVPYVS